VEKPEEIRLLEIYTSRPKRKDNIKIGFGKVG
jgi:hypothetical protein